MKNLLVKSSAVIFFIFTVSTNIAYAADEDDGAYGVRLAPGTRLITSLEAALGYNSNFFFQEAGEDEAYGLFLRPSARINANKGRLKYWSELELEVGEYEVDTDQDDYIDTLIRGGFAWDLAARHKISGRLSRQDGHDSFGSDRTENLALAGRKLDQWHLQNANMLYDFGAKDGKFRLEINPGFENKEYETNKTVTQFFDWDAEYYKLAAYVAVGAKTYLLAEYISKDIEFDRTQTGQLSRDSEVNRYRVGIQWFATGKTSGDIRIGKLERDFDAPGREDYDDTDWELGINWSPVERTLFRLESGKSPSESYLNNAGFIDNEFWQLSWTHDWTARFQTTTRYRDRTADFVGIARSDDYQEISVSGQFRVSPYWSIIAGISATERDSNAALRDYDNTYAFLGVNITK